MKKPLLSKKFDGSNGEKHHTAIYDTFDYCSCKGFQFRHECKHIRKLKRIYNLNNNQNDEKNELRELFQKKTY